jgi:hypothetical protein
MDRYTIHLACVVVLVPGTVWQAGDFRKTMDFIYQRTVLQEQGMGMECSGLWGQKLAGRTGKHVPSINRRCLSLVLARCLNPRPPNREEQQQERYCASLP